ncbi:hypothetical protein T484DRAFT_1619965, partial [Baffinella frigidus]
TLNPRPSTLNPQPSTLNPQPSTLNPQPSTLNPQPSTLNPQPRTAARKSRQVLPAVLGRGIPRVLKHLGVGAISSNLRDLCLRVGNKCSLATMTCAPNPSVLKVNSP